MTEQLIDQGLTAAWVIGTHAVVSALTAKALEDKPKERHQTHAKQLLVVGVAIPLLATAVKYFNVLNKKKKKKHHFFTAPLADPEGSADAL